MPIEDITMRSVDENKTDNTWDLDKVLRLRVVKDNAGNLDGDKLFVDIMDVYENFDTITMTNIGSTLEYHAQHECDNEACIRSAQPCESVEATTEQKCLGSFTFNLDDMIAALNLLKNHGY